MLIKLQWPFRLERPEPAKRATLGNPNDSIWDAIYGDTKTAGVVVNQNTALTLAAVYAAINILSNSLNIPLYIYRRQENGRIKVTPSDREQYNVFRLLHTQPNLIHTPSQWFQLMETSRNLYGNGYSLIQRNGTGKVTGLQWIHPGYVTVHFDGENITYDVKDDLGQYKLQNLNALDMIHVRSLSMDGVVGKPPIELARESLGFGLSTQKAGNSLFENGMKATGVLSLPGNLNPQSRQNLEAQWKKKYEGSENAGKTIILEEGARYQQLTINPQDAQFLESREFSVDEVARWFGIPPHMIYDLRRATFSNIEHQAIEFITHSVRPRARIYEQEFNWKLLNNDEDFYCEFNLNALMRADSAARATYYVQMVQNGLMSRNEIRGLENYNSVEGGDEFLTPWNLATDKERNENGTQGTADGSGT